MVFPTEEDGDPFFYLAIFLLGYVYSSNEQFTVAVRRHRAKALALLIVLFSVWTLMVFRWNAPSMWPAGSVCTALTLL